jgi:hypothetical protein
VISEMHILLFTCRCDELVVVVVAITTSSGARAPINEAYLPNKDACRAVSSVAAVLLAVFDARDGEKAMRVQTSIWW